MHVPIGCKPLLNLWRLVCGGRTNLIKHGRRCLSLGWFRGHGNHFADGGPCRVRVRGFDGGGDLGNGLRSFCTSGRIIQQGEVIVGTPVDGASAEEAK